MTYYKMVRVLDDGRRVSSFIDRKHLYRREDCLTYYPDSDKYTYAVVGSIGIFLQEDSKVVEGNVIPGHVGKVEVYEVADYLNEGTSPYGSSPTARAIRLGKLVTRVLLDRCGVIIPLDV